MLDGSGGSVGNLVGLNVCGKTCVESTSGKCYLSGGFCGNTANHCGQGCQKTWSNAYITTNIPSVDGTRGPSKEGWMCNGGDFNKQCCASTGFCGTTSARCSTGWEQPEGMRTLQLERSGSNAAEVDEEAWRLTRPD